MDAKIERIDGQPFGRVYKITRNGETYYLPSVTTVLKMKPDPELDKLRVELGPEKFDLVTKRGADRGTVMHKWLEVFYDHYGKYWDQDAALIHTQEFIKKWSDTHQTESDKARAFKIGRELFYNFYNGKFHRNIKEVKHSEIFMYTFFRGGWAGTSDFVFLDQDDQLIIQDFKSSSFVRDPDGIPKYKLQVSAYMFQHGSMYGVIPDRGEILISNEKNSTVQNVIVTKAELKPYLDEFLELLDQFKSTPEWIEFEQKVAEGLVLTANSDI